MRFGIKRPLVLLWLLCPALCLPIGVASGVERDDCLALQIDANRGDLAAVKSLLARGTPVDCPIGDTTALAAAAGSGNTDIVRLLLARGANVNAGGSSPGTPFQVALLGQYVGIATILLTRGRTPVDASNPALQATPLLSDLLTSVVDTGDAGLLRVFVERATRIDPNRISPSFQMSALDWALYKKREDLAEILLTGVKGWHFQPNHISGETALDVAVNLGFAKVVSLMMTRVPDSIDGFGKCDIHKEHAREGPESPLSLLSPAANGGELVAAAFDRAGRYLVMAGSDGAASVWDTTSGRKVHEISSGGIQINTVALDAAASLLMWASSDARAVRLLDLRDWSVRSEITSLNVPPWVKTPAVLLDDDRMLVGVTGSHTLAAWRVSDCKVLGRVVLPDSVRSISAGWKGRSVAVTYNHHGDVAVWQPYSSTLEPVPLPADIPTRHDRKPWESEGVTAVAMNAEGTALALAHESQGSQSQDIDFWDLRTHPTLSRSTSWTPVDNTQIKSLAFGWNSQTVLAADDFEGQVFRVSDGARLREANIVNTVDSVNDTLAVPNKRGFITVGGGIACIPEDAAGKSESACFKPLQGTAIAAATPFVSDDEGLILVRTGKWAARWNLKEGTAQPLRPNLEKEEELDAVALSGFHALLATSLGRVLEMDMRSGVTTKVRQVTSCPIQDIAVMPDRLVAAAGKPLGSDCDDLPSIRSLRLDDLEPLGAPVNLPADQTITRVFGDPQRPVAYTVDMVHGHMKGWNLSSGAAEALGSDSLLFAGASSIAVLPDGRKAVGSGFHVVSTAPDGVTIVDPAGGLDHQLPGVPAGEFIQDIAVDQTNRSVIAVASNGRVRMWSLDTGSLMSTTTAAASLERIAIAPGGKLLITGDQNGVVTLRDRASLAVRAQLLSFSQGDSFTWLVVTPDGHYDSNSPGDLPGASWVLASDPLTPLPVESFMKEYYEPGLLTKVVRGDPLNPVKVLEKINRVQPEVRIVKLQPESDSGQVTAIVEVREGRREVGVGKDRKWVRTEKVQDLRLFRDGQLVAYNPKVSGAIPLPNGVQQLELPHIKLPTDGRKSVEFSAYAFNEDWVKSLTDRQRYDVPRGLPRRKPRAYLISLGMNAYQDSALNLNYAGSDASEMQRLVGDALERGDHYGKPVRIALISQPNDAVRVTKARVKAVFDLLAGHPVPAELVATLPNSAELQAANPEDLLLISYAGHGMAGDRGQFYLFPYDTGASDGKVVPSALISSDDLSEWLEDVDAGDMTFIIDACQSAASVQGEGFKPGPMGSRGLGQLAYDKGMRILAASQTQEAALESPKLRHGILSYALLIEGLEDGLANYEPKDDQVTLEKWLRWGVLRVPRLYEELANDQFVSHRGFKHAAAATYGVEPRLQQPQLFDFARTNAVTLASGEAP
jgi:WD40 repeat protein